MDNVLVACPVHPRKHYSFPQWAEQTKDYCRLVATEVPEYARQVLTFGVPVVVFKPVSTRRFGDNAIYGPRFTEAWQAIIGNSYGFTHILSLESDIVVPEGVDIVSLMLDEYHGCDFLVHTYPWRQSRRAQRMADETGCTLATVELWKQALEKCDDTCALYGAPKQYFDIKKVHLVELQHLDE